MAETDAMSIAFFHDNTGATFIEKSLYFCDHNAYRYAQIQNHIRVTVRSEKREKEGIIVRYSFRSLPGSIENGILIRFAWAWNKLAIGINCVIAIFFVVDAARWCTAPRETRIDITGADESILAAIFGSLHNDTVLIMCKTNCLFVLQEILSFFNYSVF